MFGRPTTVITPTAAPPDPAGSRGHLVGNDVGVGDFKEGSAQQLWLNVAGPQTVKTNGDAYQADQCRPGKNGPAAPAARTSTASTAATSTRSSPRSSFPLDISVFDRPFTVGNRCTDTDLDGAGGLTDAVVADPHTRYAKGPKGGGPGATSAPATSSTAPGLVGGLGGQGDGKPVTTSFVVRGPFNGTDLSTAPVLPGCTHQFKGYGGTGVTLNLAAMLSRPARRSTRSWPRSSGAGCRCARDPGRRRRQLRRPDPHQRGARRRPGDGPLATRRAPRAVVATGWRCGPRAA